MRHGRVSRHSAVMLKLLISTLRIAMLAREDNPGPADLKRPCSSELPRVFQVQSAVIGDPLQVYSVYTNPESSAKLFFPILDEDVS